MLVSDSNKFVDKDAYNMREKYLTPKGKFID